MSKPERVAQTLELARHPIPEALWAELDAVPITAGDPESGRWQ
jgi:D-threo-aldose 1-dehydrogenase